MEDIKERRFKRLEKSWAELFRRVYGIKPEIEGIQDMLHDFADEVLETAKWIPNKERTANFCTPIPEYGDVMTLDAFQESVESGAFIDYDGFGHPAIKKDAYTLRMDQSMNIYPSEADDVPEGTTHIVWFNR
jgi:hypothetical protein